MRLLVLAVVALGTFATPALAHPEGHDNQFRVAERRPVSELAQEAVVKLVTQAKLPASWVKAKPVKSQVRTKNGAQQWVVTFQNRAERRPTKRLLYVLMTSTGEFISANHKLS
jgi:hypothetical protein